MVREAAPLHEVETIETPEQIELHLPLAGVGSRALAYIIDLLWQMVPIIAAIVLVVALLPFSSRPAGIFEQGPDGAPRMPLFALAVLSAVVFFVNFGYFAFFEVLWKGQSPGKRSLGLRVVRDGGYPIDGRSALVRNLLRAVDFLPALYVVGIAVLFIGRKGKRVGDYAAGTFVVKDREPAAERSVAGPDRNTGPLTPAERSLVAGFLERRFELADDVRMRVGREVADRLAARLGRPSPGDPERFMEDLVERGHD